MGKTIFRIFIIVITSMVVVWWLNAPFLDSEKDTSLKIVVTTPLIEDLVITLLGPEINVKSLINRGQNPLTAEYNSRHESLIKNADIIIINGSKVDGPYQGITKLKNKKATVINIKQLYKKHKAVSEYYWMDIVDWSHLVYLMQDQLKQYLPKRRSEINYRMTAYAKEVYNLYQKIRNELIELNLQNSAMATNHPSFQPFATLFQLNSTVITLSDQPTSEELATIIEEFKVKNISVLVPNEALSSLAIDALIKAATEAGVLLTVTSPILTLNLDAKGSGVETYLDLMEFNLRALNNG